VFTAVDRRYNPGMADAPRNLPTSPGEEELLIVFTTLPSFDAARALARTVVEERLAACVSVSPHPVTSIYRWQGQLEETTEVACTLKTTRGAFAALVARVQQLHPYEVPELIAAPVVAGAPSYLEWVRRETRAG
jgi:periplasmic divalent cation tolerance protein